LPCETKQVWDSDNYAQTARYVSDLGTPVLELLAPQKGERILDLGCGDGALTMKIAERGAHVIGIDASEGMLKGAKERGLEVHLMDAQNITFDEPFDAVFTNAALHWMPAIDEVLESVQKVLKPQGRFAGEFGGHGNVAAIRVALHSVLLKHDVKVDEKQIWYFPSAEEFAHKLKAHNFEVEYVQLIGRPTPIPQGMTDWLKTFANGFIKNAPLELQGTIVLETVEMLKPILQDQSGYWTADHVRLRFNAKRV
jgi:ubiquinone/menaquinone biosynthesis C-methylase UbiE